MKSLTGTLRLRQTEHDPRWRISAAFALAKVDRGFLVRGFTILPSYVVSSVLPFAVPGGELSSSVNETSEDLSS
jgi:hypothetical protein